MIGWLYFRISSTAAKNVAGISFSGCFLQKPEKFTPDSRHMDTFFDSKTFLERSTDSILNKTTIREGRDCPLLFVYINEKILNERPGFSLDRCPSNPEILARMEKWWRLRKYVAEWMDEPEQKPRVLVGVALEPTHRIIIGAVEIDQKRRWEANESDGYVVPIMPIDENRRLDAYGLQWRRFSDEIKFGRSKHEFFAILKCDGEIVGGQT
jgi:hypothetical protein